MLSWKCSCIKPRVADSANVYKSDLHSSSSQSLVYQKQVSYDVSINQIEMADVQNVNANVNFHPNADHYQLITVIGRGYNLKANVSVAKHIPSGTYVAVKQINLEQADIDVSMLQNEVFMHNNLQHENILPILCSFVHRNYIWIVMPLMAYGSAYDLIQTHMCAGIHGLPETAIAYILKDVLHALDYMHNRGIIHKTVCASHILVSAKGDVCLSGLRLASSMLEHGTRVKRVHNLPNDFVKSLCHSSPELLEQNLAGYDTKSDIYSVGVTACELANGIVPFSDVVPTQMLLEKLEGLVPRLLDTTTIPGLQMEENTANNEAGGEQDMAGSSQDQFNTSPYLRTFSQHFHNFIEICTLKDPLARPTAGALLQHSFFKQARRKSSVESVTVFLKFPPVTELLAGGQIGQDEACAAGPEVDSLVNQLDSIAMDEGWSF